MSVSAGPDLVTNNLVFHLDPADRRCYPGSGSICKDIANINGNGTITNITYDLLDKSFLFNGINSNISFTRSFVNITNSVSYCVLAKFVGYGFSAGGIGTMMASMDSNGVGINISSIWAGGDTFVPDVEVYDGSIGDVIMPTTIYNRDTNLFITNVVDGTSLTMYLNNQRVNTISIPGLSVNSQNTIDFGYVATTYGAEAFPNSKIYKGLIYNRPLTHKEVLQNYNAIKGRARLS